MAISKVCIHSVNTVFAHVHFIAKALNMKCIPSDLGNLRFPDPAAAAFDH